jgi:hypothetical protein
MEVSRRAVLTAAAGVALAAALDVRPARAGDRPVSMAMHLHGSFSEGYASYEAHLEQARRHGVDVVFWTDHDFRCAAHAHPCRVRFDGPTEADGLGGEWGWSRAVDGDLAWEQAEFVSWPRSPQEDGRALRLGARTGGDGGTLWYAATASNRRYSVSLADTTLTLDVRCEETGPGRELILHIESSYHPARAGVPAGRLALSYRIGGIDRVRHHREGDGRSGVVELPAPAGRWHRVRLRPVDDIATIWPDHVAEDNSLWQLRIGVRSRDRRAATRAVVDRLRIDRGRAGPALRPCAPPHPCPAENHAPAIALRRDVLARYAAEYPDVTWYEAWEVSLTRHLAWIGGELAMPELPVPAVRDNDPAAAEAMVALMHANGALAQWCHPLDVATPTSLVELMVARDNLGADLVEIGRSPQGELLDVLDGAARNAVFFTAVGASDDHEGQSWSDRTDNHLTYAWAPSTGIADLQAALRAGRAWFGNLARWRGELEITAWGRPAMGGVAVTPERRVPVELLATNLPPDAELEVVTGAVDRAAPVPDTRVETVRPADDRHRLEVDPGDGIYLRTQIRGGDGLVLAAGNPVWLLREPPPRGIPPARVLPAAPEEGRGR